MDRSVTVAEQKLAEKLVILNRRGRGMLTRIYNIKKVGIYHGTNTHLSPAVLALQFVFIKDVVGPPTYVFLIKTYRSIYF